MDRVFYVLRAFFSVIAGALCFMFGDPSPLFYALILFMVIDYITGVINAAKKKQLSSDIGGWGILKKIAIILIVSMAHAIDLVIMKEGNTIQAMTMFFYLSNEGISILENCVGLGLPVPEFLRELLIQLRENKEGKNARTSTKRGKKTE